MTRRSPATSRSGLYIRSSIFGCADIATVGLPRSWTVSGPRARYPWGSLPMSSPTSSASARKASMGLPAQPVPTASRPGPRGRAGHPGHKMKAHRSDLCERQKRSGSELSWFISKRPQPPPTLLLEPPQRTPLPAATCAMPASGVIRHGLCRSVFPSRRCGAGGHRWKRHGVGERNMPGHGWG